LAIVVAGLVIIAGALLYMTRRTPRPAAVPPPAAVEPPGEPSTTMGEPTAAAGLPALNNSDSFVRRQIQALSASSEWSAWLSAEALLRRFASAVAAVRDGKSPRQALDRLAVKGPFTVQARGGRAYVSAASFARYDRIAAVIAEIDAAALRPAWKLLHPLVEEAWAEVAPAGVDLDQGVADAIDHLLETPQPTEHIEVFMEEGLYRYSDRSLEALTPAQKHLLRMGPANAARVRAALRAWRSLIESTGSKG
jgi:hypothetical protein